jgi:FMN phosphatase YigB (HAD superfamily)
MKKEKILIIDFNRTLYDPESQELFAGVVKMLGRLKSMGVFIVVATRVEGLRTEEVAKSGLTQHVHEICNVPYKNEEIFHEIARGYDADDVWVVGDVRKSEIAVGLECGFHTIWLRNERFGDEKSDAKPEYTVEHITEIEKILQENL